MADRKGTDGSWERVIRAQRELDELQARVALARDERDMAIWALSEQGASNRSIARGIGLNEASVRHALKQFSRA